MRISRYGVTLPMWRLPAATIGEALGIECQRGERTVAGHDQDSTSLAVDACRVAVPIEERSSIRSVVFSTTSPAYTDKTNATAIHAALCLQDTASAFDMVGSCRSSFGALATALRSGERTLVAMGDVRTGLPGSMDERVGGDAGSALVVNGDNSIADVLALASRSTEVLERWRAPTELASRTWEERFGLHTLLPLGSAALVDALAGAALEPAAIDHLIVSGPHRRCAQAIVRASGAPSASIVDDHVDTVGYTGSAHIGLLLGSVFDVAAPGSVIAVVSVSDGADALILRTTDLLPARRALRPVAQQVTSPRAPVAYGQFLAWRGQIQRESPRRPDPVPPSAPPSFRSQAWKYGFVGSRCTACGQRYVPPVRVCAQCSVRDEMAAEPMADIAASIVTFTTDHLAHSQNPPVVVAVADFDGGGRYQCELTDFQASDIAIGSRVEMTFRRTHTSGATHNYFWKAQPCREGDQ